MCIINAICRFACHWNTDLKPTRTIRLFKEFSLCLMESDYREVVLSFEGGITEANSRLVLDMFIYISGRCWKKRGSYRKTHHLLYRIIFISGQTLFMGYDILIMYSYRSQTSVAFSVLEVIENCRISRSYWAEYNWFR